MKKYTPEFKEQVVAFARENGVPKASDEFEVSAPTIRGWIKKSPPSEQEDNSPDDDPPDEEENPTPENPTPDEEEELAPAASMVTVVVTVGEVVSGGRRYKIGEELELSTDDASTLAQAGVIKLKEAA